MTVVRQPPSPGRPSLSKKEIIKKMKKHLTDVTITNKVMEKIIDAFLLAYKDSILENHRVEIRNFGVIRAELVRGRLISHPETKESTVASPYYKITFKPSATFKEALRARAKKEASET
jgi:nucleoid DNA-binding protein